jgi:hypothetical protein
VPQKKIIKQENKRGTRLPLVTHGCNPSYLGIWDHHNYGPGKQFMRPISKINREKWTGGVAKAVQCLLCKCKVLSSNPSPPPKTQRHGSSGRATTD